MDLAERLQELSKNLYWAWHPEFVRIFRDIDKDLWRKVNHNPVEFLHRLANQVLEDKNGYNKTIGRVSKALDDLHSYLEANEIWGAWPLTASPLPASTHP